MEKNISQKQSSAGIARKIKSVATRYNTLHSYIQGVCLDIISHAERFGDCRFALELVNNIPPRQQKLMVEWFKAVSPIRVSLGDNPSVKLLSKKHKAYTPFDTALANTLDWWKPIDQGEQPEKLPTSFNEYLAKVEKYLKNQVTEKGLEGIKKEDVESVKIVNSILSDALSKVAEALKTSQQSDNEKVDWSALEGAEGEKVAEAA